MPPNWSYILEFLPMRNVTDAAQWREQWRAKVFMVVLFMLAVQLVFYKFVPDLGTAAVPAASPSSLASYETYQSLFMTSGNVFYPRLFASWILWKTAHLAGLHVHSSDVRLHPLRLAAALLTPLYGLVGLIPVLWRGTRYRWLTYTAFYCVYNVLSLYVFYPYDMPSIALISIAAFLVIEEDMGGALFAMLVTGIFRESSLHVVFFVFVWALVRRETRIGVRMKWFVAFSVAFVAEYLVIRKLLPGHGMLILNVHEILFGHGLWSLTSIVTVAVIAIVPIYYVSTRGWRFSEDWRHNFFLLNCFFFPAWIVLYRVMNGNISELRMLIPILLPLFYGLALSSSSAPDGVDGTGRQLDGV